MATTIEKAGGRDKWRWLHRIGYITTALIAAEVLLIGFFFARAWLQEREWRANQMEESRTHDGPLQATSDKWVRGSAIYLLGKLPPSNAVHGDGVRFVAMPSFNRSHFAFEVYLPAPRAAEAKGILMTYDQWSNYAPLSQREFAMPAAAYRSLATKTDKITDNWPGDSGMCLDGTPVAFERVRGSHITSGIGNCSKHYDQLQLLMWNYLRRFAPGKDLPTMGDWEPSPAERRSAQQSSK